MALYNRQKNNGKNKSVPPEVKQYYASEQRERVGLAWLIAFISLIVTVAVVAGLFFGGRWAYRKYVHKNNEPSKGVAVGDVPKQPDNQEAPSKPNGLQPTTKPPTDGGKVSLDDNSSSTSTPNDNSTSDNSSSSSSSKDNLKSANSQSTTSSIANTGPGNTIEVFIAVSILATVAHLVYQKRKLENTN